jgi:hypothetical protein
MQAAADLNASTGRRGDAVITLSSVLLPAPLRPITPTTSPGAASKLTSRSAQKTPSMGCDRAASGGRRRMLPSPADSAS